MDYKDFNDRYEAEISAIFTRFPSFQKVGASAYKPGLEGMVRWDMAAGHPHEKFASIHVAGTNGKGSVSHLIASVLASAGYRVGLYTSPHILDFRERMKICDGSGGVAKYVPKENVYDFLVKWKNYFEENSLSFFEITTMMAFDWFAREHVDFAVIETGLGGRLDSTNIITPVLSVITNIGLDHCDLLGDTREKIAFEKAGIIKPGIPAVIGENDEEIADVFEEKALECESPLFDASDMFPYDSPFLDSLLSEMDLHGEYQRRNLSTALSAISLLSSLGILADGIEEPVLYDGITGAASRMRFFGRWQTFRRGNKTVILDIGHNAHGLKYNFSQLARLFEANPDKRACIIFGMVSDKDVDSVLRLFPLLPGRNIDVVFTNAESRRALPASELEKHFVRFHGLSPDSVRLKTGGGEYSVASIPSVTDAVRTVLGTMAADEGAVVYIGGSTFVVAEALPLFI